MLNPITEKPVIRPAGPQDLASLRFLIDRHDYYHRHLDWRSPADWLGQQPFFILSLAGEDVAALGCPPLPEGVGWIRLFVSTKSIPPKLAWKNLFDETVRVSPSLKVGVIVGLGFADWFCDLLEDSGFDYRQDVIGLSIQEPDSFPTTLPDDYNIRPASLQDLQKIADLDARAFERIWQHPYPILVDAYRQAGYISVITTGTEIVGYQLSTCSSTSAHLARLAVEPKLQNLHLGTSLIADLFQFCHLNRLDQITVNTQSDNRASLALYRKMGFILTGEKYPVYLFHPAEVSLYKKDH